MINGGFLHPSLEGTVGFVHLSNTGNRFGGCGQLRYLRGHAKFLFPVMSLNHHSAKAIEGLYGKFGPPMYAFNHKAKVTTRC